MEAKEKALEFYNKFQQYYWDENNGWMPDDKETKKLCEKIIQEIINILFQHHEIDFWKKVKQEMISL